MILKSISSLILHQVLQGCLSFQRLNMFFLLTSSDIDFESKFFYRMCQVLQDHLIVARVMSYVYESVPSAWSIFVISVVRHILLVTCHWYSPTAIDFEIKFFSGFVSSASRSLIVARGRHGHFGGNYLTQIN